MSSASEVQMVVAGGRLARLKAHLLPFTEPTDHGSSLEPQCLSAQTAISPPGNLKGKLMVVDERTGKKYEIEVSEEGTVKATDFKKVFPN